MTFLIDHQLPPALARHLTEQGFPAVHVLSIGIDSSDDATIREYARANDMVIISKDSDFQLLSQRDPQGPPVIWVRLGNCRTPQLIEAFDRNILTIINEIALGKTVYELR